MRHLRLLIHYAILVGLPFLGVVVVMKIGERLSPPSDISGEWILNAQLAANEGTACATRLAGFRQPVLRISQSGVFISVQVPNEARDSLSGRLEGVQVLAEAPPALFGDDVFDLMRLSATVRQERGQQTMRGVLAMPRRVECVPVAFVAVRAAGVPVRTPR